MLKKQPSGESLVQVTFSLPAAVHGSTAYLVGDFNNWNETSHLMERDADGCFVITIELHANHEYQFRYLIDNLEWHNDWQADRYVQNTYGGDNSVVIT
jgi:1,4-alpha-glucan branching enzyme